MTRRFAVVHEAAADFQTATELADRALVEAIAWLDEELLGAQREWVAELPIGPLTWKGIKKLAREAGLRVHGHFDGAPGMPDALAARRAIRFLVKEMRDLDAILLIRDQDDQPERRKGLDQARTEDHSRIPIVIGLAVVERECWVVSGFEPLDEGETSRLEAEQGTLGFDPRFRSHDMTACKDDNALRSPKRVLRALATNDRERERRCWKDTPMTILQERGTENGLAAFLGDIWYRLGPLIGHVRQV